MLEPQRVSELVDHDRAEVHVQPAGGGIGDRPAPRGGVAVDRHGLAVGLAELKAGKVTDRHRDTVEVRVGPGGDPLGFRCGDNRRELRRCDGRCRARRTAGPGGGEGRGRSGGVSRCGRRRRAGDQRPICNGLRVVRPLRSRAGCRDDPTAGVLRDCVLDQRRP